MRLAINIIVCICINAHERRQDFSGEGSTIFCEGKGRGSTSVLSHFNGQNERISWASVLGLLPCDPGMPDYTLHMQCMLHSMCRRLIWLSPYFYQFS